jgi:hypothetical protein
LKRAPEQESLMPCHHFIDLAVAVWGDEYACQELADVAIHTHFSFDKKFENSLFFFFLIK